MRVTIKYVSVIASITGKKAETVETAEGTTVAGLFDLLCDRYGSSFSDMIFMRARDRKYLVNFLVNNVCVSDSYTLRDRDELTVVLALAGG